jgi:hypothetical protein
MANVVEFGTTVAMAAGADALGELSDAELEFVVGGLIRVHHHTVEVAAPEVTLPGAAVPLVKPSGF